MTKRLMGFAPWARVVILFALALLAIGLLTRFSAGVHAMIFGNTEAKREHGAAVVAREQTAAEGRIADQTIASMREREVYREHVTEIVHDGQREVNDAWNGETVGKDVDSAGADALCRLHDSLCRRPAGEDLQPLR